jgi:hypothetical protein
MRRSLLILLLVTVAAGSVLSREGEAEPSPAPLRGPVADPLDPVAAGDASPARRRFIARVERTCARFTARGQASMSAYIRRVRGRADMPELVTRFSARWHERRYRALGRLGRPPEGQLAYARWIEAMRAQTRLEARYVPLMRAGRAAEAQAAAADAVALRARRVPLARRFGMRGC